jgi:hypothetical protein
MTISKPTDTVTILRSDKPMAKGVVIGEDGVPVVGKVKMGFLFDVAERSVAGLSKLDELVQGLQHDDHPIAQRGSCLSC